MQSDSAIARATVFDMPDCIARHLKHRLGEVAATSACFQEFSNADHTLTLGAVERDFAKVDIFASCRSPNHSLEKRAEGLLRRSCVAALITSNNSSFGPFVLIDTNGGKVMGWMAPASTGVAMRHNAGV